MLTVGLTGNIGSGKSTVAEMFSVLGIPVYNADEQSKKQLDNPKVIEHLVARHGRTILNETGRVDRRALAALVFNDAVALRELTSLLHPVVMADFGQWASRLHTHPYVIMEAAVIHEYGFGKQYDRTIHVSCPVEVAMERVMQRDQATREQVTGRMRFQMEEKEKAALSDFVIRNDGLSMVIPQVLALHKLLSEAGS